VINDEEVTRASHSIDHSGTAVSAVFDSNCCCSSSDSTNSRLLTVEPGNLYALYVWKQQQPDRNLNTRPITDLVPLFLTF
jgi:hypothetical protein